jgi:putative effector of murein hydrolase LrgA (UPF0299 family)
LTEEERGPVDKQVAVIILCVVIIPTLIVMGITAWFVWGWNG